MKYSTELKIKRILKKITGFPGKFFDHITAADHDGSGQWASPWDKSSEKSEVNIVDSEKTGSKT